MKKNKNLVFDLPNGLWVFSLLLCLIFVAVYTFQNKHNTKSAGQMSFYTAGDFQKVPKIDSHFHCNSKDGRFVEFADSINFRILSINVDTEIPVEAQLEVSRILKRQFPGKYAFFGTFPVGDFGTPQFAKKTIACIDRCMKEGASGIKIWKNIGMTLLDKSGKYVMADDPRFDSIYSYIETRGIPMIAHLGEPKNCWLPVDQMTTPNDKRYYQNHPQYHMFLHPEAPSYQDQIDARNHLLEKHPNLTFIGAHLASEEWSIAELAKSFDRFPNLKADLAARITHLQYQSILDREKVRNFMIKYQDRILYGTDMSVNEKDTNLVALCKGMRNTWTNNWLYLATDSLLEVKGMTKSKLMGLQLPREVIDKIFFKNSKDFFGK